MYEPTHKCGIGAVINTRTPFQDTFSVAGSEQNRGYDGCGVSFFIPKSSTIQTYRRPGKVIDVFWENRGAVSIDSDRTIFNNRYRTAGDTNPNNLQPMITGGFAIAHNGNVYNFRELAQRHGIEINDNDSDTRVIAEMIRRAGTIEGGIRWLAEEAVGAFNLVVMDEHGVIGAYRDPWGYHPLFGGHKANNDEKELTCVASEKPAIYALKIYEPEEFKPGELWLMDGTKTERKIIRPERTKKYLESPSIPIVESICPFEISYFMRPGGSFNGISIPRFREGVGVRMTRRDNFFDNGDYIVVPVHDSGRHYGIGYSRASAITLELSAFIANRDMARQYMEESKKAPLGLTPQQMARLKNLVNPEIVRGKKIIVTDDSIVRAGTLPELVQDLFDAGAKEVYLRIGTPPIIAPCHMGMNHSDASTLRAANTMRKLPIVALENIEEEVRAGLNPRLNSLHYLPLDDYKELLRDHGNYCLGCFTGKYPFPLE